MTQQQQFIPPQFAPDVQNKQQELLRNQLLAKQLLEQEAPQGKMMGNHYVAPHWSQHLAHQLNQYRGQKAAGELPKQQAEIELMKHQAMSNAFGFGGSSASGGGQAGSGMTLPGMDSYKSQLALSLMGPEKYITAYGKQFEPTNEQRNLSHLPEAMRNQILTSTALQGAAKDGVQMVMGADGRTYAVPAQGYVQSQAALQGAVTGAQESARAGYDLVEVPDGQGGTQMMSRSQAVQTLGGLNQQGGQSTPTTGRATIANGFGSTPSAASQRAGEKLNDDWVANTYRPVLDNAAAATDLIGTISAMRNIPVETGFGAEYIAAGANLLSRLGVKDAEKVAANAQQFQALAMDRLQTELMKQKGPQTDEDAKRAARTFAELKNTPQANKFIFDFAEAKANMELRKAKFYEAALPIARQQGDLTEVDRRWRKLQGSIFDDPLLKQYQMR